MIDKTSHMTSTQTKGHAMSGDRNYVRKDGIKDIAPILLVDAMDNGGDPGRFIVASEAAGQRQLVASAVMPTQTGDRAPYEALGFTFGEPVDGDPLFTHCTLPEGWTKQGSDHNMWSYVIDQYGRRRVAVFYKAAFYDRDAFARLETPHSYLNHVLFEKTEPVLDDTWLTAAVAVETLDAMLANNAERVAELSGFMGRGQDDYWSERIAQYGTEAGEMRALRDRLATK